MKRIIAFLKKHWILVVSALYIIWPLDLISEFFGPIGLIDDTFVLMIATIKIMRDSLRARPIEPENITKELPASSEE